MELKTLKKCVLMKTNENNYRKKQIMNELEIKTNIGEKKIGTSASVADVGEKKSNEKA
jgi:hypothetical protein